MFYDMLHDWKLPCETSGFMVASAIVSIMIVSLYEKRRKIGRKSVQNGPMVRSFKLQTTPNILMLRLTQKIGLVRRWMNLMKV